VMYERGFVVERDSTKAVEWYQKAVDGNVAVAKHNLALLLREGRGAPRDGKRALELFQAAARQGMAASMFSLGDIYERGDVAPKDPPLALAWFTLAVEFERQRGHGAETPLAKIAQQRIEALQRVLTPTELERGQKLGQLEFQEIVEALTPKLESAPPLPPPPDSDVAIGWPKTAIERVRAIQQALIDLNRLRGKADGVPGAMTRAAISEFEKSAGLPETGEPSREAYVALLRALQAQRDTVARSPLPPPPKPDPPKPDPAKPPAVKAETASPPVRLEVGTPEPPPPPRFELGRPDPPTSTDIVRAIPDPEGWPANRTDQIRLLQSLLGELKLINFPPTGVLGPLTLGALRDFQRKAGLGESGEPSRGLYLRLKAERDAAARPPPRVELGQPEAPPSPPTPADIAKAAAVPAPSEQPKAAPEPARAQPQPPPAKPDSSPWPADRPDQVRAIQALLRELKLMNVAPTGHVGPLTIAAIRDYQRMAGLPVTGEPSQALFESLKEMRTMMERRAAGKPR